MKAAVPILKRFAHWQTQHPVVVLLIIIAATLIIAPGAAKVETVATLEGMMPPELEPIATQSAIRDAGLGQDAIGIVIKLDAESYVVRERIDEADIVSHIAALEALIAQDPQVLATRSIASDPSLISPDARSTAIIVTTDVGAHDASMRSLAESIRGRVSSAGTPAGTTIELTGTPIVQQRLSELITSDQNSTRIISTLLVFLITMLIFASFTSALVPIAVVTLSVTWLYATMGHVGLPISTLAGGVAAMVIGIGIDFAIHLMNKFRYERKAGYSMEESIEQALVDTGVALIATSLTTTVAFLAFLFGQMPEMGRFGLLMAIGIGYSLLFTLFGLPALLVLEERGIRFLAKRMRFGIEGEYHLEEDVR